jgi:DHA1 family tetracycline resistance protein-like MFS transporter
MPVMPDLLEQLTGGESVGQAAAWGGWLTASYALMQFVFSPILGNLSDAYGRRPVMLASLFVLGIDYLIMATTPYLGLLFVARMMSGAAAATFSTANAFIADISPPEKRAQNFGVTGAAFGLGFVFGPALGGLLGEFGPRMPFYAAAALTFANLVFGWVALPESLKPENRRPFKLRRANSLGTALNMLRYPAVAWLLVASFIYNISHYVYPVIWSYYTKEQFGWTPNDIGISLAFVGIGFAIAQGGLIKPILGWLGAKGTAIAGFAIDIVALICLAFAWQGWMIYALIPLTSLSALIAPAMQGLMTNRIPDNQQGELQGAVTALSSLSFIITPLIMTQLFFHFTANPEGTYFPGAPFLAAAGFSLIALIPLWIGLRRE